MITHFLQLMLSSDKLNLFTLNLFQHRKQYSCIIKFSAIKLLVVKVFDARTILWHKFIFTTQWHCLTSISMLSNHMTSLWGISFQFNSVSGSMFSLFFHTLNVDSLGPAKPQCACQQLDTHNYRGCARRKQDKRTTNWST